MELKKNDPPLPREFYLGDTKAVARALLGCLLVRDSAPRGGLPTDPRGGFPAGEGRAAGIIVETEAYLGKTDAACHSVGLDAPKPGHRTEAMFREGGRAYVYLIYGMYCCFNVVTRPEGIAEAVLIRALEPVEGLSLMRERRGLSSDKGYEKKLCSGPGKLCQALDITRADNGTDLTGGPLRILRGTPVPDSRVAATPRINVDYAGADALLPYRFVVKDSPFLSVRANAASLGATKTPLDRSG
ncbi:MAG: DNA-3-methyladenine glycosylase [Synergistaceae bacterium]|nr:DNA-3-methyladenine glycosylase [Synergistaceae bacterium]